MKYICEVLKERKLRGMSYREKQKIEMLIEVLSKISMVMYVLVVVELLAYVLGNRMIILDVRTISIEKYALIVAGTAIVGYLFSKLSNKVKDEFIKKLKYSK